MKRLVVLLVVLLTALSSSRVASAHTLLDFAAHNRELTTLAAAVRAAGLSDTLRGNGPFTLFAPTNEAFAKLPKKTLESLLRPENRDKLRQILTYHVLSGEVLAANVLRLRDGSGVPTVNGAKVTVRNRLALRINDAQIVRTDVLTENGVLHAIDTVLIPPGFDLGAGSETPAADIVDTAVKAGQFKTLAAALQAAGLVETLKGNGPFTVFAPTDAAFAKLPRGTVESLLKPENRDKLRQILTYHVVPKEILAERILRLGDSTGIANTVNGAQLRLRNTGRGVVVDDANVVKTDIRTKNGIIHVIDTVLMPHGMTL